MNFPSSLSDLTAKLLISLYFLFSELHKVEMIPICYQDRVRPVRQAASGKFNSTLTASLRPQARVS